MNGVLFLEQGEPSVLSYFAQSNLAGKCIVVALMAFSLIAWTLMVGKYLELKKLRTINRLFAERLNKTGNVLSVNLEEKFGNYGPFAKLVKEVVDAYYKFMGSGDSKDAALQVAHIENSLQREVANQTMSYESKMVILGSIVSGAPFLGLLGTVWGVMDAFGSIALKSSASIQSLAPGVSGALLTTVAALLVAIPSVFGYNFLITRTKQMVIELENFASSLADRVELEIKGN